MYVFFISSMMLNLTFYFNKKRLQNTHFQQISWVPKKGFEFFSERKQLIFPLFENQSMLGRCTQNHSYHPSQALQRLVAHPPGADWYHRPLGCWGFLIRKACWTSGQQGKLTVFWKTSWQNLRNADILYSDIPQKVRNDLYFQLLWRYNTWNMKQYSWGNGK